MQELNALFNGETYDTYRPVPFWVWNDKLEKEQLAEQIAFMDRDAIGGFFVHARAGLLTEYLSKEWMDCVAFCCEEAEKRGMQAWIYDENGWPSGFAGGKVLTNEEHRDKYLTAHWGAFDPNANVHYIVADGALVRTDAAQQAGEYLNLYIHRAVSTADILNPDAVDSFLHHTHEAYKAHLGENFTKKIRGFFTDEPQYYFNKAAYTDKIAEYFRKEYDEDILDSLGLLFTRQTGYRSFRYRYWKGMQKLMQENFAKRIYNWCEKNNMIFTGHFMGENSLSLQMRSCAGVMPMYEFEHIPGIDWLGKGTSDSMSITQCASVTAQMGRRQLISESFACCGWDVTPGQLRRIAGFQCVNGVNLLCYHMIPYSERGSRKYEYPAHYIDRNPWIKEGFRDFNTYFARLGFLLGEGEETVKVALLHPIRSAYLCYEPEEQGGAEIQKLEKAFFDANKLLKSNGIAFHHLDETLLSEHGFVRGSTIGCGKCSYAYLVIPQITNMDSSTEALVRQFVQQGGKVLMLDEKPAFLEGEPFDYSYLESNCTLKDIVAAQEYRVTPSDGIYSTCRTLDGMQYLYAINASDQESYSQTCDFGENVRSFVKVDLRDLSTVRVPLTVCLAPGEDALLLPDEAPLEEKRALQDYEMRFENASISFGENGLPVDVVRFSTDGKVFSEPWPIPALFQRLLEDRYAGALYLKYEFEVETLPQKIFLKTEAEHEIIACLNGIPLGKPIGTEDGCVTVYDITDLVKRGHNEYTVQRNWFEGENVYFALFGEGVTETLLNSIVYDSELQPIILTGQFGVYTKSGYKATEPGFVVADDFYIGAVPERVSNITLEGFPFLAGEVTLTQKVCFESENINLKLPGEYLMAEVTVNNTKQGKLLFEKNVDISSAVKTGENEIQVRFLISNRNLLGPHHFVGSKTKTVTPRSFQFFGTWQADKSQEYHAGYDLKLF